ncbi:hypothetical protein DUNSADRAFT_18404 [Dunaliella salina]|uniref:Uncharacterized protein n=1 Tax=Dunaliella salina TaxID=3046 RepID=A0ABQ7GZ24_DUNSA|nr:hypothetical protein DUNSADRAFT_18404 [Dunaliella salina]|eukprot:KAF5839862.1 hypothetical protein DUNSADRAFT_18404 [Dunaliella salina]
MGNAGSRLARAIRPASRTRRLPEAPREVDETLLLRKIEQQESERKREVADDEELGRKDTPLDGLLSKLQGSIQQKPVKVTGDDSEAAAADAMLPKDRGAKATTMSAADFSKPIPIYTPSSQRQQEQQEQGQGLTAPHRPQGSPWMALQDEEQGRAQAFALREVLEAKNLVEHLHSQAARSAREHWSMRSDAEVTPSSSGGNGSREDVAADGAEASTSTSGDNSKELDIGELASRHGLDVQAWP